MAAVAGDHHRQGSPALGRRRGALVRVQLEHAGRLDQAHELVVQQDVRLPLEVADLLAV